MNNPETGATGVWRFWPLRLVLFFLVLVALYAGAQVMMMLLPKALPGISPQAIGVGAALAGCLAILAAYRLLVRWTERRRADELSALQAIPQLLGGTAIGLVLFAAVYAVLFALGAVSFHGWNGAQGLAIAAATSLLAGVGEEAIFRGAVYRLFENGFGTFAAIVFSGALFGLIHAANKGATPESTAAIALEAGILLAAAYLVTRSLWLPIGLHFGWNFTEGGIFGAAVSGGQSHGLVNATLSGPQLITGGAFGPEASIPAVSVCLVAAIVMLTIAAQRGEWRALAFRLRAS